jgi:hypothetical protein
MILRRTRLTHKLQFWKTVANREKVRLAYAWLAPAILAPRLACFHHGRLNLRGRHCLKTFIAKVAAFARAPVANMVGRNPLVANLAKNFFGFAVLVHARILRPVFFSWQGLCSADAKGRTSTAHLSAATV